MTLHSFSKMLLLVNASQIGKDMTSGGPKGTYIQVPSTQKWCNDTKT